VPDAKQLPVGPSTWEDSWVATPPWPTLGEYRHILTGEIFPAESVNGRRILPLHKVFGHCPAALLERLS
jgi:(1->4)-alpha-D-glucan 1-alpha-D-glucosylmutase